MSSLQTAPAPLFAGVHELERSWGWILAAGIAMVLAGMIAIGAPLLASALTVLFLGWVLLLTGVVEVAHSFGIRRWGGFVLSLLLGILDIVVGGLMLTQVGLALEVVTLLLAVMLTVGGLFRMVASVAARVPNWGWSFVAGLASFIVGLMIWRMGPTAATWVIGLYVGIALVFRGWAYVVMATVLRSRARRAPGVA